MERPAQMRTPLLTGASATDKRQELKQYFLNTWLTYESLFSLIADDSAYFSRPEPLRHPLIFYYGHTAVFFINKLILGRYLDARIDPRLESICAVGVDEMSWDDLDSNHYQWPSVDEVRSYRRQVKDLICELIEQMPLSLPIQPDSLAWVILMGCEHERIHLETSSVIMRMLPLEQLQPQPGWMACPHTGAAPLNHWVSHDGGTVTLGKQANDATYGWDNEYGQLPIQLAPFETSAYLVSNGEYRAFVEAGGYRTPALWTDEGQRWLDYTQASMPRFWLLKHGAYWQRNLLEEIPLPANWPVEVNYLEAKAFCNWKAQALGSHIRLPTEAEWLALRQLVPDDAPQWQEAPGNLHLDYFASSCPVDRFSHQGVYDIVGNVWQWTETAIDGYPGFQVHPLYDDFSTPTFDQKHNLFKGGSWISTGNEALASARYAFRRHFFQHAGFRYVQAQSAQIPDQTVARIETERDICLELVDHYGGAEQTHYLTLLHQWLRSYLPHGQRALDLGCSVGRLSFELARDFDHVDGVDFSARLIQHGVALQQGATRFALPLEGELVDYCEVNLASLQLDAHAQRVHFSQGDACNLKPVLADYDLVVAANLLEQLYQPRKFLSEIGSRIRSGGLLLIASDFGWDAQKCQPQHWLGGIKRDGENVTGEDGLRLCLAEQFELLATHSMSRQRRLDRRRSLLSDNLVQIWRKRPAD